MLKGLTILIFLIGASACGGGTSGSESASTSVMPTSPSPTPKPTLAGERWNLTQTFRDFTGPADCGIYTPYLGQSNDWSMNVERSGDSIRLVVTEVDSPDARIEYNGTVIGDVLAAASKDHTQGRVCGGARVAVASERRVSGRYVEAGQTLAAQEVTSVQLSSGETVVFYNDWRATKK